MATLSDIINRLGGGIVYDERTKRFHDLTANYKMVSSEQALRQTTPGRPSRDGMTTQYVTQTSFDALRRDVYAMMSSIAQNAYLASNELRKSLEAQRKDTESLRRYENQVNEDRLEGNPQPGMMERIGGIAGALGRGTRRAIGIAPYAIGGLGLAGLAAALAATLLSPETVRELDETQREIQQVISGVSNLASDIYNLRSEILLMAEIAGTVIGGLLGIRAINRFANRTARGIQRGSTSAFRAFQQIFGRTSPTSPIPSTPSSTARLPAAANMNQPTVRPTPGSFQSNVPRPGNMERPPPAPANDPNRGGSRLAPQPGQRPPPPPERVPSPTIEPGSRAPTSRPAAGSPRRIPGMGLARIGGAASFMATLVPSIAYYMNTPREQQEVDDIEGLGENARNYALQFERATTELNRLRALPEEDPARSTLVIQANEQQINVSRDEVTNHVRRLQNVRDLAQQRRRNYELAITTEQNNPYGANQANIDNARRQLNRQERRIELAEAYLTEARGLQQMMNNSQLIREMPTSGAGVMTEAQRQQAVIALGQGSITSEELARQIQTGVISLPPIQVRGSNQPTPTNQPGAQSALPPPPAMQPRPAGGGLPAATR